MKSEKCKYAIHDNFGRRNAGFFSLFTMKSGFDHSVNRLCVILTVDVLLNNGLRCWLWLE